MWSSYNPTSLFYCIDGETSNVSWGQLPPPLFFISCQKQQSSTICLIKANEILKPVNCVFFSKHWVVQFHITIRNRFQIHTEKCRISPTNCGQKSAKNSAFIVFVNVTSKKQSSTLKSRWLLMLQNWTRFFTWQMLRLKWQTLNTLWGSWIKSRLLSQVCVCSEERALGFRLSAQSPNTLVLQFN